MGSIIRVHGLDLTRFRAMLGSGEEAFCAKVLRTIPGAAERRGLATKPDLLKEWSRSVTGLVLGAPGEALAAKDPFDPGPITKAGPGLSLAFASILEGFAASELDVALEDGVPEGLRRRPLFGLEADGELVRWGALGREATTLHPLIASILAKGLDAAGLS